jgi:hypothetical protein
VQVCVTRVVRFVLYRGWIAVLVGPLFSGVFFFFSDLFLRFLLLFFGEFGRDEYLKEVVTPLARGGGPADCSNSIWAFL